VEEGIRGGMTFINTHHISSNTPRIPDSFDNAKPEVDLLYVDANNLYGNALSQKLPQSGFRWMNDEEIAALNIQGFDYEGDTGHLFEVDLHYPKDLQDRTTDLPFAPEKLAIPDRCLTDFMRAQWTHLNGGGGGGKMPAKTYRGYEKLMLTHFDKTNYTVHGKLLQYYLRKGMVLTKVHRAMTFKQSAFFEPYISYNSKRRQEAKNAFEKDFYKLKNNSLFGKTMENVRKR